MNAFTQDLSQAAPALLWSFAWPMFWQSSLVIGLLFLLDLLLRRKLRPAVRYALWMVLLVKLALPPALAFPTGLAWWLRPSKPETKSHQPTTAIFTYGPSISPTRSLEAPPVLPAESQPVLTAQGWLLLFCAALSLGLLAGMLARWRQAAAAARRASPAPRQLEELLQQARGSLRLNRSPKLKLSDGTQSPAVFGLFRPVILLPQSLTNQLSPTQFRAVLLHELIHLQRGDVWINCAQAFLQIAYWWHPLLWLANARIRRLREEAVDDAVMYALQDDAESYPQTLLEVAKLVLYRPLSSLALLGILETKNALRQRIERLLAFPVPPKPGLTFVSVSIILLFSAVALPMGRAPVKMADLAVAQQAGADSWPDPRFAGYAKVSLGAHFLIVDSSSLELFLPSAAGAQVPFLMTSNELAEVERKLSQAGAEAFPRGEMLKFAQLSGGRFHYRIGGVTNNTVY
jgi:bla regulator protein BlaR1